MYSMPPTNKAIPLWIKENIDRHLCQCGCGEFVRPTLHRFYRGKRLDFIAGHQMRGHLHGRYKGGVVKAKGYIWFLTSTHPRRTRRGYVKRAWLVAEEMLGRYLVPGELVHHKDGNRLNDSHGNIEVSTLEHHARHHATQRLRSHLGRFI